MSNKERKPHMPDVRPPELTIVMFAAATKATLRLYIPIANSPVALENKYENNIRESSQRMLDTLMAGLIGSPFMFSIMYNCYLPGYVVVTVHGSDAVSILEHVVRDYYRGDFKK